MKIQNPGTPPLASKWELSELDAAKNEVAIESVTADKTKPSVPTESAGSSKVGENKLQANILAAELQSQVDSAYQHNQSDLEFRQAQPGKEQKTAEPLLDNQDKSPDELPKKEEKKMSVELMFDT